MAEPASFTDWRNHSAKNSRYPEKHRFYENQSDKVMTDGGQEIAVHDPVSAGQSWAGSERPSTLDEPSGARTTFHARDVNQERRYDRLWKLHHGRGHTHEGWSGDVRVRIEEVDKHYWARVVLSRAEVSRFVQKRALRRVMTENLNGFSRYYAGTYGAALGFACLYMFETPGEAKNSYVAVVIEQVLEKQEAAGTVDGLIDFVWGKYRGDEH